LSEIAETLRRIASLLEGSGIDYMLIGGYALPSYGRIRTTLDIDIAVAIETEESFHDFCEEAKKENYSISMASFQNPVWLLLDERTGYEIEAWKQPDGVEWDQETLDRRRRITLSGVKLWIISPEDFIVNKLARPDRSVIDEQDVKSVLERKDTVLDWLYLERRAKKSGVWALLQTIKRNYE